VLWDNVDAVVRNLHIAAVPTSSSQPKKTVTGFGNVKCIQLLTHLQDKYHQITEKELEDKVNRIKTQWHPLTTIESIFVKIEDGIAFTSKGNDEPTTRTILHWDYNIVAKTELYDLTCIEWRQIDTAKTTKDWAKCKDYFKAADRDIMSQETTGTDGYHGASHAATNDIHVTKNALLDTTKAALVASEIALVQGMSQASLSSSSRASIHSGDIATKSLSVIIRPIPTPDALPMVTRRTWITSAPRASIHTRVINSPIWRATWWAAPHPSLCLVGAALVRVADQEGRKNMLLSNSITMNSNLINSSLSDPSPPTIIDTGATGNLFKGSRDIDDVTPISTSNSIQLHRDP
jgi:hypothetical protein